MTYGPRVRGNGPMRSPFIRHLVIVLALVLQTGAAAAANELIDTTFAVYRNGSEVGTRNLRITRNGDSLEVVNETRIAVDVLFITVFEREERLHEVWRDGRLVRFSSRVNNDGERFEVAAVRTEEGTFRVEGVGGTYEAPRGALPATYWHDGIVMTDALIHVMRGTLQHVTTTRVGEARLRVGGEEVKTTRYRMTGDERVDLWFNEEGLIVRALRHGRDGDKIDFRAKSVSDLPSGLSAPGRAKGTP